MEKANRNWGSIGFVAAAFIASAAAYASLPEQVPAAWDAILLPKDLFPQSPHVSRNVIALVLPSVALALLVALRAFKTRGGERFARWFFGSRLNDKAGEEWSVQRFERTYDLITTLLVGLVVLIHFMSLALAFDAGRPTGRIFLVLLGLLFAAIGNLIPRIRPNPVMGFRTTKTLHDPALWLRAHRVFGLMLFTTGVLVLLLALTAFEFALIAGLAGLVLSLIVVAMMVRG